LVAVVFAVAPCGARFDDFKVMAVLGQSVHLGPRALTLYRSPTQMSTQSGRRKCSLLGVPHWCTRSALQKTHAGPSALTLVRGCDEIWRPIGRVEVWRGGCRSSISVCRPFRPAVP
jgi:hypothetical protein